MQFHTILRKSLKTTFTKLRILGNVLGVDPSYLSRFSTGKILPSSQMIDQLCIDLGKFFWEASSQYPDLRKELKVKSEQDYIDLFKESYERTLRETKPRMKFKPAEFTNYFDLISELKEVIQEVDGQKIRVSLPETLLELVKQLDVEVEVIKHMNQFIYFEELVYYALQPFENYQKVMVTRFAHPSHLKEIEICLE